MSRSNDDFRYIFVKQLLHFDNRITEFRDVYDSFDAEDCKEIRAWLEAVQALGSKCPFDWPLQVKVEHDEFDDDGEKIGERNAVFTASTLLDAMESWEKGKLFTPDCAWP